MIIEAILDSGQALCLTDYGGMEGNMEVRLRIKGVGNGQENGNYYVGLRV